MTRILTILSLIIVLSLGTHAYGDDAAKILGQTSESGSLPLWTRPTGDVRVELGKVARNAEQGVVLVGLPKVGTGTAWVISKTHRLLVTNAHVADMWYEGGNKMLAIPSGTSQIYLVNKVWYHPGVRRFLKNNPALSVRSDDFKVGSVDANSPDLAILQLAPGGPDPLVEFSPATTAEIAELFAQPAAIMGFPSHDTSGWPALGENAAATFHEGAISRLTDFLMNPSVPPTELQYLQYTMATWPGFSGSPIFLPSGRVAAVHNSAPAVKGRFKQIKTIPHGVRVDCVLEMLVHHGLDGKVPFKIDKSKVLVERWTKPDARSEKALANYAKATALVFEAWRSDENGDRKTAIEKCNLALTIVPNFASAYSWRACFRQKAWVNSENMPKQDALDLLNAALEDAMQANKLTPDADEVIQICRINNSIAWETRESSRYGKTATILTELLNGDNLKTAYLRGGALTVRANAFDHLDQKDAAIRDYNEAIRILPQDASKLLARARFWEANDRPDLAASDRATAQRMSEGAVWVEWKGKWYPANVLKTENGKSLIHYSGYESNWDEWVTPDRIKRK